MNQRESNNYALYNLQEEVALISDVKTRGFAVECIFNAPGLYWYRPSAFFKSHHPDDELGEWGNLIHVKRVLVMAKMMVEIEDLSVIDRDTLYPALIIHDIGKYGVDGEEERIRKDHAEIAAAILEKYVGTNIEPIKPIIEIVRRHMGRWAEVKPVTVLEKLGHYCDCIASRVNINIPVVLK